MYKHCTKCHSYFEAKFPNAKLCYDCWHKREDSFDLLLSVEAEVRNLRHDIRYWQNKVVQMQQQKEIDYKNPSIPEDILRRLIMLSHPDRHNNSSTANEMTKWLLGQRKVQSKSGPDPDECPF